MFSNTKTIVFAFVALLATTNAWPHEILISGLEDSSFAQEFINVVSYIASETLKYEGLDPYVVTKRTYAFYDHEDSARGRIDKFVLSGLSNFSVNSISFSDSVVDVYITVPRIAASFDNFVGDLTIGSENLHSEFSGSIAIVDFRVVVHIGQGLYNHFSDNMTFSWQVGKIESNLNSFILQGRDVTANVNNFVANVLPNLLNRKRI